MVEWDPVQYLRFEQDRLRPVRDLLARVELTNPKIVVDLGCGPATSTKILAQRFGGAKIVGVDNSVVMIDRARLEMPDVEFVLADAGEWHPPQNADLLFSNAVFHWLPDHDSLISKLAKMLNPQGVLAFQMPDNMNEPSHLAIAEVIQSGQWKSDFNKQKVLRTPVAAANDYYDWLVEDYDYIDIWRTTYAHVMPGHEAIVEWMKGAALTPYLGILDDTRKNAFLDAYLSQIKQAYPLQNDGTVIFHFPRLFVIARKAG